MASHPRSKFLKAVFDRPTDNYIYIISYLLVLVNIHVLPVSIIALKENTQKAIDKYPRPCYNIITD